MRIAITGSTGLLGSPLATMFAGNGHSVVRVVRSKPKPGGAEVQWDTEHGFSEPSSLEKLDAVVHLSGENVAAVRWTDEKKNRIRESRLRGTAIVSEALARLTVPPRVLVSASGISYYGDCGAEIVDESSAAGHGFLADICKQWEAATLPTERAGIRVVHLRFGMVLSAEGGALAKMLPAFRLGAGGKLGNGRQYISWVTLDDAVAIIDRAITRETLNGAVNVVAPNPVTNAEFTRALARVLRRPAFLNVPAFMLRLALGEMADELLLASVRAVPRKLLDDGFAFGHVQIESALRSVLRIPTGDR